MPSASSARPMPRSRPPARAAPVATRSTTTSCALSSSSACAPRRSCAARSSAIELVVHYQPILNVEDRSWSGVEALVRWQHPERGLLSPDEFIPLAEETGLIVPLGMCVLEMVCRQARQWSRTLPGIRIAVNASPVQLAYPTTASEIKATMRRAHLTPAALTVEVTESALMEELDTAREVLEELQAGRRARADRRLRHRLLVARAARRAADQRPQDRPALRPRARPRPERDAGRAGDRRPRSRLRAGGRGRGDRGRRGARRASTSSAASTRRASTSGARRRPRSSRNCWRRRCWRARRFVLRLLAPLGGSLLERCRRLHRLSSPSDTKT